MVGYIIVGETTGENAHEHAWGNEDAEAFTDRDRAIRTARRWDDNAQVVNPRVIPLSDMHSDHRSPG